MLMFYQQGTDGTHNETQKLFLSAPKFWHNFLSIWYIYDYSLKNIFSESFLLN